MKFAVMVLLVTAAGTIGAQSLPEAARAVLAGRQQASRIELSDQLADYVRQRTNSSSPVYAEVSAVKEFPQPTCKRLQVLITAPEAVARDKDTGKTQPFSYRFEMNLCADGNPPESTPK